FAGPAEEAFAQARGGRCGVAVLVVDIDHFKRVNDQHGHDAGDAVIRHVGALLAETVRGSDTVARFGGEEFVVLLLGLGGSEAGLIAERLCVAARGAEIAHGGRAIAVTVSIGVATVSARDPDIQAAIARADAALYEAKARGRDRVSVAVETEEIERAA
ncbi:sensor domain-containing diguanylate cyclase, partial [Methylobacterium frigidaeris]